MKRMRVQTYLNHFPHGAHTFESMARGKSVDPWCHKDDGDYVEVLRTCCKLKEGVGFARSI